MADTPPRSAAALLQEARALYGAQRYADAASAAFVALKDSPRDPDVWNALGVFLRSDGKPEESIACYRRALAIAPAHAGAWTNLGNSLKDMKQVESAIACHRRALALQPENGSFHHNMGIALVAAGRFREALAAYHRGLLFRPNDPHLRWDRALAQLQLGEFAGAWVDYAARFETGELPKRAAPGQPWNGQRFTDKRLVVLSEQGFGDAIWAARYFDRTRGLGGTLIVESRRELIPLFAGMNVAAELPEKNSALPDADWHCHLCSLPGVFTATVSDISGKPYLTAPADRQAKFASAMERGSGKLRVGIVWSGSTTFKGNRERAVPLTTFVEFFAQTGVQLYSLQKSPPKEEASILQENAIIDLGPLLGDFADTAAAVSLLDLVIMTDSAVAHLAGALGCPVWVLVGKSPFWIWGGEGQTTPWYDSVRIFRAPAWNAWNSVFDEASGALIDLLSQTNER